MASKGLKKLIRELPNFEELTDSTLKQSSMDDRATALVMAGWLDSVLETALLALMAPDVSEKKKIKNALFGPYQPLGSFSSKILCGYAFGLYGSKTKNDLDTIRDVRNVFAHAMKPVTFETEPIKAECDRLKLAVEFRLSIFGNGKTSFLKPKTSRDRFVATANIILMGLRTELSEENYNFRGPINLL